MYAASKLGLFGCVAIFVAVLFPPWEIKEDKFIEIHGVLQQVIPISRSRVISFVLVNPAKSQNELVESRMGTAEGIARFFGDRPNPRREYWHYDGAIDWPLLILELLLIVALSALSAMKSRADTTHDERPLQSLRNVPQSRQTPSDAALLHSPPLERASQAAAEHNLALNSFAADSSKLRGNSCPLPGTAMVSTSAGAAESDFHTLVSALNMVGFIRIVRPSGHILTIGTKTESTGLSYFRFRLEAPDGSQSCTPRIRAIEKIIATLTSFFSSGETGDSFQWQRTISFRFDHEPCVLEQPEKPNRQAKVESDDRPVVLKIVAFFGLLILMWIWYVLGLHQ